jgi:hypothetical protein
MEKNFQLVINPWIQICIQPKMLDPEPDPEYCLYQYWAIFLIFFEICHNY